jgi:hypothetical protein
MKTRLFQVSIAFLFTCISLCAQRITVDAPTEVLQNESFVVRYEVNDIEKVSDFFVSSFLPLQVISGPSRSSSVTIINGDHTSVYSLSYRIIAKEVGSFFLPSATVKINGKQLNSDVKKISVLPAKKSKTIGSSKDIFIKAEIIPNNKIYLGQQVKLQYEIFFKGDVSLGDKISGPDLSAFDVNYQPYSKREKNIKVVNSQQFQTAYFDVQSLFPQKVGAFTLAPLVKVIGVATGVIEEDFGFFSRKEYAPTNIQSNEINLDVLPLPSPPENFANAVGDYKMSCGLEKRQKGYVLTMIIRGNGDMKSLAIPKLTSNEDIDIYPGTKVNEDSDYESEFIHQTTYEFAVVPKKTGRIAYNVVYNYFDTPSEKYVNLEQNAEIDVNTIDQKSDDNVEGISSSKSYNLPPWLSGIVGASIAGLLGFFGLMFYHKRNTKTSKGVSIKQSDAVKITSAININTIRFSNDTFGEARKQVLSYLEKKYGIMRKDQNRSYITSFLNDKGEATTADKIDLILEKCEQSIYGGKNTESDKEEIIKLINDL